MKLINLAGDENCDVVIEQELTEAGIPHFKGMNKKKTEVPSQIYAGYKGWEFERAWYYWRAVTTNSNSLPFGIAQGLFERMGRICRVAGHACGVSPTEWYNKSWQSGVDLYHIDTQEGLNEFVKAIDLSTSRQGKGE